ncbi:diaminobutyrate acetyltransferase [Pseudonocardia endophytica]|nr:diaminobutyrate acetyltransferase [Pseudonocardia endophytica]
MTAPEKAERRKADPGSDIVIGSPSVADGVRMWELAVASGVLDAKPRYAYALWCRDFAQTSVVARRDGDVVGYVTGYMRPEAPTTVFVWQVCVSSAAQGAGVGGRMLDAVFAAAPGADRMETTITPDNESSIALFTAFAKRQGLTIDNTELFGRDLLGDEHEPEFLYSIRPAIKG